MLSVSNDHVIFVNDYFVYLLMISIIFGDRYLASLYSYLTIEMFLDFCIISQTYRVSLYGTLHERR